MVTSISYALRDLTRSYKKLFSIIVTLFISLFILSLIINLILFKNLNFFSKKTETNLEISDLISIEFMKLTYVLDRYISVLVFQLDF